MPYKPKINIPLPNVKVPNFSAPYLIGMVADTMSIGTTLATIYGIGKYATGASPKIAISLNDMPFAIRFVLITVIATALGWAYGSLSTRMTRSTQEYPHAISHILALLFAAILVAAAEMISDQNVGGLLPQVQFFTFIGLAIILWLCRFQYRSHAQYCGTAVLNRRAIGLLVFTATTVLLLILLELG